MSNFDDYLRGKRLVCTDPEELHEAAGDETYWPVLVLASDYDALRSRLADIESQNRVMWDVASDRETRLAKANTLVTDAYMELRWWMEEHPCCKGHEGDLLTRLAAFSATDLAIASHTNPPGQSDTSIVPYCERCGVNHPADMGHVAGGAPLES